MGVSEDSMLPVGISEETPTCLLRRSRLGRHQECWRNQELVMWTCRECDYRGHTSQQARSLLISQMHATDLLGHAEHGGFGKHGFQKTTPVC